MDELSPEDKLAVARARKIQRFLSQPFHVAEVFTGSPGKYVSLKDTIKGFKMIVNGECDHCPSRRSTWSAPSRKRSRRRRRCSKSRDIMAKHTIHVDVVSAEEQIYSGEAEFVVLPGEAGELGIYPRHTPLITRIKPGAVRIKPPGGGEEELIFVAGGILEVQPDGHGAGRHRDPRPRPRRGQGDGSRAPAKEAIANKTGAGKIARRRPSSRPPRRSPPSASCATARVTHRRIDARCGTDGGAFCCPARHLAYASALRYA